MEDTLRDNMFLDLLQLFLCVLILVLMEDTLRELLGVLKNELELS